MCVSIFLHDADITFNSTTPYNVDFGWDEMSMQ